MAEFDCFIVFSLNFVTMIKQVVTVSILKELTFLMLGTGVEEFLRHMESSTYPIHNIQTPFEMLKNFIAQ